MLGTDRHHLSGGLSDEFLAKYGPHDVLGQKARGAEADRLLRDMGEYEQEVRQREVEAAKIDDNIKRLIAEQTINRDYLISFGVFAEHRSVLRQVLHEILQHRQLTPKQAVELANYRAKFPDQSSNGVVVGASDGLAAS